MKAGPVAPSGFDLELAIALEAPMKPKPGFNALSQGFEALSQAPAETLTDSLAGAMQAAKPAPQAGETLPQSGTILPQAGNVQDATPAPATAPEQPAVQAQSIPADDAAQSEPAHPLLPALVALTPVIAKEAVATALQPSKVNGTSQASARIAEQPPALPSTLPTPISGNDSDMPADASPRSPAQPQADAATSQPRLPALPAQFASPAPAGENAPQQTPQLATAQSAPAPAPSATGVEIRSDPRLASQIEAAIDHLTDTRQAARAARPEVVMKHAEFGMVSMRLDGSSGDLRATLAARDPGFVPAVQAAVQAALADRAIAASSETATGHRGPDSHSQSGNGSSASPNSSGQNYGSSPGSSQGSSQPRLHHQDPATGERGDRASKGPGDEHRQRGGSDGVFA